MAGGPNTYVLAVRLGARETAPADWQERVRKLLGVSAGTTVSPHRIQIQADTEAFNRIRDEFGEFLHIELLSPRAPNN